MNNDELIAALTRDAEIWRQHGSEDERDCAGTLRAAIRGLITARAEVAELRQALRARMIDRSGDVFMCECGGLERAWVSGDPEDHAPGCLAAIAPSARDSTPRDSTDATLDCNDVTK